MDDFECDVLRDEINRTKLWTPVEAKAMMQWITQVDSVAERHELMDHLLISILRKLGYNSAVDIFNETEKWYA